MASDYMKLADDINYVLETYEKSIGLAFIQELKEQLLLKIKAEVEYYKKLEERNYLLAKENCELRSKMTMPMPPLDFKMGEIIEPFLTYFYWQMQPMAYRIPLPHNLPKYVDDKFWKTVRQESYKGFLKLFRKQFEDNFERFASNYK